MHNEPCDQPARLYAKNGDFFLSFVHFFPLLFFVCSLALYRRRSLPFAHSRRTFGTQTIHAIRTTFKHLHSQRHYLLITFINMRSTMFSEHTAFADATVPMDFYRFSSVGWFLAGSQLFFASLLALFPSLYAALLCFVCGSNACTQKPCTMLLLLLLMLAVHFFGVVQSTRA